MHDRHHFEVKLDYTIDPKLALNRYRVEAYFFVPTSLGVTDLTYTRQQFYRATQAYIRFKTPTISLQSLLSPTTKASPFYKIDRRLPKLLEAPHKQKPAQRISYELRLLACLVRANMRDRVLALVKHVHAVYKHGELNKGAVDDVCNGIHALAGDLTQVLDRLRSMRTQFQDPVLPDELRSVFNSVDEYTSINAEHYLTILIEEIDKDPRIRAALGSCRDPVRERVRAEQEHRKTQGYPTQLDTEDGHKNEGFMYRSSALKKFVMSVLFLRIKKEEEGRGFLDLVGAIAAGVAMLVAAVLSIWGSQYFAMNTIPFLATVVATYMLKDRIKEWVKRFFGARMTRWVRDYSVEIRDPTTGVTIGRCRESFAFARPEQVPPKVMDRRKNQTTNQLLPANAPEVILKYEKDIALRGEVIDDLHGRMHDINDIIRFNVSSLLVRTDDPVARVHAYDPGTDSVKVVECPKVYHINVVFVLHGDDDEKQPPQMERVRVVVDKAGIRRLEEVAA